MSTNGEPGRGGFYHGLTKFLACFVLILCLPLFLLVFIGQSLYLPIDFIVYSFSRFKKETGIGYSFYASGKSLVKLYNVVKKNSLPLEFVKHEGAEGGYFISEDRLFICNSPAIHFVEEQGGLCLHPEHSERDDCKYISISEYLDICLREHNELCPDRPLSKATIVAKVGEIEPEAVGAARESADIAVFGGSRELRDKIIALSAK